jgi:hypothetical protein
LTMSNSSRSEMCNCMHNLHKELMYLWINWLDICHSCNHLTIMF